MFSTPEQGKRWSDLMPLITWELWLARPIGIDKPLPWQKAQKGMTPGGVYQGMTDIIAEIGTSAKMQKCRGNAPGWLKGRLRRPRTHFEVVKKSAQKAQNHALAT